MLFPEEGERASAFFIIMQGIIMQSRLAKNEWQSAGARTQSPSVGGSCDAGGGTDGSPLRLFTAWRRMYSIWPFTLRNSACAQPSRSAQRAGSMRRRNDFRSAIRYLYVPRFLLLTERSRHSCLRPRRLEITALAAEAAAKLRIQRARIHHRMHL